MLLIGGYAYFDAARLPISISALSLTPSNKKFQLKGPHKASSEAVEALVWLERLSPVTLKAFEEQGLLSFAWVHANEKLRMPLPSPAPEAAVNAAEKMARKDLDVDGDIGEAGGGTALSEVVSYPFGAFVYTTAAGKPVFFALDRQTGLSDEELGIYGGSGSRLGAAVTVGLVDMATNVVTGVATADFGGAAQDFMGYFKNLADVVNEEILKSEKEEKMVSMVTGTTGTGSQVKVKDPTWRWIGSLTLQALMPTYSAIILVVGLGSVARYDTRAYDVIATLFWFNLVRAH